MPTYVDEEDLKHRRSCDGLRIDLRDCVKVSKLYKLQSMNVLRRSSSIERGRGEKQSYASKQAAEASPWSGGIAE